jgi:hypothetical protein
MMSKVLGLAVVAAVLSGPASAGEKAYEIFDRHDSFGHREFFFDHRYHHEQRGVTQTLPAPEIDPASAMSALTMLASGLVILRGRRLIKK